MPKKIIDLALPIGIVLCIFVIYLPLPTGLMDFLLAANITISVVLLLSALFARSPLELSAFPALLLVTTLGRLALNIATTRLILTRGPVDGELAAGEVVKAFAQFVTGDQLIVGAIIFAILFIVQFVVITKGATRIGEVAARFALDGLPGRQMAIDADLNAGLIDHKEAQTRRQELLRQADFHGAMDGASKYVRGDAIAGLLITVINLAGGLFLGLSSGLSVSESAEVFSKLTIGDGLVSQLPALLISIAAGLLVSRGSERSDLPSDSVLQLIASPMALAITALFVGGLAFTNLPQVPLLLLAVATGGLAWFSARRQSSTSAPSAAASKPVAEPAAERMLDLDALEVRLGSDLLRLADAASGGRLLTEISNTRKQLALDQGILLPKVRVRDNLQLPPNGFEILLQGHSLIRSTIPGERYLELHPTQPLASTAVRAIGLPWTTSAVWVSGNQGRAESGLLGPVQVIARCLEWAGQTQVRELLTRDAVQQMLDELRKTAPTVVGELVPGVMSLARVQRIFQELLLDGVSLRPLALICEGLADLGNDGLSDWQLIEAIRLKLGRQISERLKSPRNVIRCFGLGDDVSAKLHTALSSQSFAELSDQVRALPNSLRQNLVRAVSAGQRHMSAMGLTPLLVVTQELRPVIAKVCESMRPGLRVVGSREIDDSCQTEMLAEIRMSDLLAEKQAA
ncbi:MAG: flagellar biosynthesis protein FlhA [Planctomycetota bacterium]